MKVLTIILIVLYVIGILLLIYELLSAPTINDDYNEWNLKK